MGFRSGCQFHGTSLRSGATTWTCWGNVVVLPATVRSECVRLWQTDKLLRNGWKVQGQTGIRSTGPSPGAPGRAREFLGQVRELPALTRDVPGSFREVAPRPLVSHCLIPGFLINFGLISRRPTDPKRRGLGFWVRLITLCVQVGVIVQRYAKWLFRGAPTFKLNACEAQIDEVRVRAR
jgi:hypothetical protein